MKRILAGLALALIVAAPAMAARHYNGKPLPAMFAIAGETIAVAPDPATFGGTVTTTVTSAHAWPVVYVHCYGNGSTVGQNPGQLLSATEAVFRDDLVFTLGPTPSWSGGGADCYATLLGFEDGYYTPLAETTFAVGP